MDDEALLDLRLRELAGLLDKRLLAAPVRGLVGALEREHIEIRPHVWLSTDWFSPDGVAGIALPFYLANQRLMHLEKRYMLCAEGGTKASLLRLLFHEAGHAVDSAFQLARRKAYREAFGKRSVPYRRRYGVRPLSRAFVLHLDHWYAQSHPAEDFAETFAVWLRSRGRWRARYRGSPAYQKLLALSGLMDSIRDRRPLSCSREEIEPLRAFDSTLRAHYARRRRAAEREPVAPFEHALQSRFVCGPAWNPRSTAASALARLRAPLARLLRHTPAPKAYAFDCVLTMMIQRARERGLEAKENASSFGPESLVRMIRPTLRALERGEYLLRR